MKKNISILLLTSILILLITGMGFTFQNEPDGFRGLKWGDAPTEDMKLLEVASIMLKSNCYYREDDKNNIGSANLGSIFYDYTLYSNQFYKVSALFYGETNYDILKIIFEEKFGEPTLINEKGDRHFLIWQGEKTKISLTFDLEEWEGFFSIESMEILPETPEDNKQKEFEKAKEDF